MNNFKFTIKDCDDVIRQCLQISDAQAVDFEIIPRHENNFIFKITGEYESEKKTLCLYAKTKSRPPEIDRIFYEDFTSVLEGFNPRITPKFHCGKSELLFFEDLTCQKFQTNLNLFDLKHVHQVLNVLAQFHAAGFAYEKVKSKKLDEEYELKNSNFDLKEGEDLLWACVDNKERLDEVKIELEERQVCPEFAKTLCHSNLSAANILFHYNNGTPDECKLVNFRGTLYAPPVYDVLQVIFFNTNEEFRQQNFDDLLSYYHSHLTEEMKKYNLDIDKFLSDEDFRMSSHYILPLIKLETAILQRKDCNKNYHEEKVMTELKEILSFPPLSREDCYVVVKNAIKSPDFSLVSFHTRPLENIKNCPPKTMKLIIKIRHFIEEKTINCFVVYSSKEEIGKQRNFCKGIFIYKRLLPQFLQLGITGINCCLPQCYFQRFRDLMVYEDMSVLNFRSLLTLNRSDFTVLSLMVKKLAKLHACTIIFEERMSEKSRTTYHLTNDYEDYLKETLFFENGNRSSQKFTELILEIVNLFPELKTKNTQENLKKCIPQLLEIFCSSTYSDRFRNVLCHGDIRTHNILVQFDDDVPIDCRFVNCRSVKYCPPAYDFLSAVYLTTNRETRIKNEEALKLIYYDELKKYISSYNYRADRTFLYQEFVDCLEHARPLTMLKTIMYNIAILCAPEEILSTLTIDVACDWVFSKNINLLKVKQSKSVQTVKENVEDLYEICKSLLPDF